MTNEEAIKALRLEGGLEISGNARRLAEFMEGLSTAIDALQSISTVHIDREAWVAEWIYPENEFNLPKCSKCGCNSKDATYGHKNNFCPKCGRAMTPEAWGELEKRLRG